MASKPLQRSLAALRKLGYEAGITERWNQFAHVRQDFCGFADAIVFHPTRNEVLAINACADNGGDVSAHFKKFYSIPAVRTWLMQPCRKLMIFGWGKKGAKGKRKLWTLRALELFLESGAIAVREVQPLLEPAPTALLTD